MRSLLVLIFFVWMMAQLTLVKTYFKIVTDLFIAHFELFAAKNWRFRNNFRRLVNDKVLILNNLKPKIALVATTLSTFLKHCFKSTLSTQPDNNLRQLLHLLH